MNRQTEHRLPVMTMGKYLLGFLYLFAISACATEPDRQSTSSRGNSDIQRLFALALEDINDVYIDKVDLRPLVVAGLENLSQIERDVTIQKSGDRIGLLINGSTIGSVKAPSDNDPSAWASVIDDLLSAGRGASEELEKTDTESIYRIVFNGVLRDLDRFSRYDGMESARRNRAAREGFGGIGVSIVNHPMGAEVKEVTKAMPAGEAGVVPGDIITAINDSPIAGDELSAIVQALRGKENQKISIEISHAGKKRNLSMKRALVIPDTVFYKQIDGVAFFRISNFNQRTATQFKEQFDHAKSDLGSKLRGIVLDLRGNRGGVLDQAVDIADFFIDRGRLSTARGRHKDSLQLFDATDGDISDGLPIAVLQNSTSASASEILASALQDNGRAVLIGSNSYGKGTVQTVKRLPNDGELILTWARLHAPSGYVFHHLGVLPNVCTSDTGDVDTALDNALVSNWEKVRAAMTRRINISDKDEANIKQIQTLCPGQPRVDAEVDIEVAKRIIQSADLYKRAVSVSKASVGS